MKNLLPLFILIFAVSLNAATFTVTRSDDRNETCISGVDCSLREAVNAANAAPTDDVINFAEGLTKINLVGQPNNFYRTEIPIGGAGTLTINGLGANVLTIDADRFNQTNPDDPGGHERYFRIFTTSGIVTITDVTLTGGGNLVGGGGIYVFGGTLILNRVHVTKNDALDSPGGGVYYDGGTGHQILNSTFSANRADWCGAFYSSGTMTVINSTITGNHVYSADGSAFCSGNTTLRNVTIAENTGGFLIFAGELNLGNTIIAGGDILASNIISKGNNIITARDPLFEAVLPTGSPNINNDYVGDYTSPINPLLAPLADNGGPTPTHALLPGSLAIDGGNNALAVDLFNNPLLTDQRWAGFPRIVNNTVDIGAFEVQLEVVGPPTSKDQCKNSGWMMFNNPRIFKNQGDCIQFVNTGF